MTTKDKILNTFYELVAEKGYEKASMNDIVKTAGVSKGAIYHHFNSKEELFIQAVTHFFTQVSEDLFDISQLTKDNYIDTLKQLGLAFFKNIQNNGSFNRLFYEFLMASIRYENIKNSMKDLISTYFTMLESIFIELKEREIIDESIDHRLVSQKFFIFLDALSLYITYELDLNYEELWSSFVDQLFKK